MNFEDALVYLKSGTKITRHYWKDSTDKALYIGVTSNYGPPHNTIYFITQRGSEGVWIPSNQDILATDWEVVKEEVKV